MTPPKPSPTGHDAAYVQSMALKRDHVLRRRLTWYCIVAIALMFISVFGFSLELLGMPIEAGRRASTSPQQITPGSAVLFASSSALLILFLAGLFFTARTRPADHGPHGRSHAGTGRHRLVVALTWLTVGAIAIGTPAEIIAQWVNLNHGPADAVERVYQEPDRAGWTATNGYGIFFVLACLMVPMRWTESMRIALPGLAVLSAAIVLLLYPPLNLGLALGALAAAYTVGGAAWSAWRHSDFEARLRAHALGARYTDLHGQVSEISAELKDARRLHESLFPAASLAEGVVNVAYRYQPAGQIGGDFLYIHREPTGHAATIVVIDVSGHGVAAALAVNRLHGELQRFFSHYPAVEREAGGPGHLLSNLNTYACAALSNSGMFATAVVVRIDPARGQLSWASAGHPTAFLRTATETLDLDSTATMLGVLPPDVFDADQQALPVAPGDALLAYTDGAVESRDERGMDYTPARLRDAVANTDFPRIDAVLSGIERHRHGKLSDDTLIVEMSVTPHFRIPATEGAAGSARQSPTPGAPSAPMPYTHAGDVNRLNKGADHGSI